MKKIKILFCSTAPVLLNGLKSIFNSDPQFKAEFTNNCINLADYESDFDLLFIDFDLPNAAVFTLLDLLALKPRKLKILLFTSIYSESLTAKLTNYNMEAVIAKTAEPENLKP